MGVKNRGEVQELCRVFTSRLEKLGFELGLESEEILLVRISDDSVVAKTNACLDDFVWEEDDGANQA